MATMKDSSDKEFRGQINKKIVVRQYPALGKTVLSAYPDMSNVKASPGQKSQRLNFKEAQTLALQQLVDPKVRASYQALCKPGQRPHNVLISELLKKEPPVAEITGK